MSQPLTGLSAARLALTIKRRLDEEQGVPLTQSDPIAIIGMGCRFPGNVRTPDEYWQLLLAGTDTIREAPASRWSVEEWYDENAYAVGKTNGRYGSFLDDADAFDPAFFGLAPREAPFMDPQHRLLLEVTWESLWEAGIAPHSLAGSRTSVFMALCNTDYSRLLLTDPYAIGPSSLTGASHSIASGRISYLLDLQGPSVSLDTACSSSLVAVHLACQSLRAGETTLAIAGGVTLHLTPQHYIALAKLGMLAPDGRCKTFDARADGFVPGEGSGVIVLKRLADALADGDRIHAVIRGTATTQDGRTTVLTAPNGLAQQAVVRAALANGRVGPEQVGYVETHGTGTALGDPIEVEALSEVLGSATPCALGSVKTNLGHLEAAAGIAGLIKATLALEHEEIPPNLHFNQLNSHISLDDTQFFVPVETRPWPRGKAGRFAGVSSFGFGGTNAHIVLEEAPRLPQAELSDTTGALVLPISARDPDALMEYARQYRDLLASADAPDVTQLCRSAAVRRSHYEERIAVAGTNAETLRVALDDLLAGRPRPGSSRGSAVEAADTVFVCSGQGSQWPGMGVRLLTQFEVYRATIDACDAIIREQAGWSLREQLEADETTSRLGHTEYAQPAIVATEIALARLWESWGVVPAAVVGHSVGEISAAHIAGAIDLDEAMRIVLHRGRLMERATGTGRMAAASITPDEARRDIARFGNTLSLAAVNSPQSIVISGEPAAVEAITTEWTSRGVSCRPLPVDYAFHSAQMEPFRDELVRILGQVSTRATTIPMISTVTGQTIAGTALGATYWGNNIRQPVLLSDALRTTIDQGTHTFVEVGPHAVLSLSVQECLTAAGRSGVVQPSLRRNQDERATLFAALGTLYTHGATIDWAAVYPGVVPVVTLPAYPYQRQSYWVQRTIDAPGKARQNGQHAGQIAAHHNGHPGSRITPASRVAGGTRPLLGRRIHSPLLSGAGYELELSTETLPFLADHIIGGATILPMTAFLEMVLEAVAETTGNMGATLTDVVIQQPLVLPENGVRTVQLFLEGTQFRIFSLDDEQWTLHANGQFSASTASQNHVGPVPSLPTTTVDVNAYYRDAWENGAHFGPAFQTISELFASGDTAAATVQLDANTASSASQYQLHPALLDGCFQPVLATSGVSNGPVWVPIAIDRFVAYGQAGTNVRSILTARESTGSGETLAADVWVTDAEGHAVATIQGLRCKRIQTTPADTTARFRYHMVWQAREQVGRTNAVFTRSRRTGPWLVVSASAASGDALRKALEARGESCSVLDISLTESAVASGSIVPQSTSSTNDTFATIPDLAKYRGIVHLVSPDDTTPDNDETLEADFEQRCKAALSLVQTLATQSGSPPPLWIVTQGAFGVTRDDSLSGFMQSGVLGLARTVSIEHPELDCKTIDLDPAAVTISDQLPLLADALLAEDTEACIAIRGTRHYVPRLAHDTAGHTTSADAPRRLSISVRGTLDNLQFETLDRREPGPGEVEVAVDAASLNFRDVLNALGMYPGNAGALGAEFAGRIVRTGEGVTRWTPGDRVMGIAWGSFANYVVTDAQLVTTIPAGLDAVTAATIPNAYLTAHHCLLRIARLKAGERVLIHAGAGGVGMAAIHLAKHVGAEIFSTAGSDEKRAYLQQIGVHHVLDSRSLEFSTRILELTNGQGVDVVLNSLSGDFISASFAATGSNGRFVEIGKMGLWTNDQVAALGKHIEYTVVDLSHEIDHEPAILGEQLDRIGALITAGQIPPLPARVFAFDDAQAAFRYMAQARQIGRVILTLDSNVSIQPNATYLVTGGLGGIGLRIARWLAERGAKQIVLVSRSTPSADARENIDAIEALGTAVSVYAADISNRLAIASVLETIRSTMPPLRGIIHAAGIIDDGVLVQQTWERFQRVLAPKVYGAWHLHELTSDTPLDFFMLYSSVSSVFGAPGQGAYAAANAFLDALAARRVAEGRTALSINWGAWADVGMAARVEAQGKRRVLDAIRPMSPDDCVACLEPVLRSHRAQAIVVDANWSEWTGHVPPVLADLVGADAHARHPQAGSVLLTAQQQNTRSDIAQQITNAPASSRRGVLITFINGEARRVLGLSDTHPIDERQSLLKMGLDSLMAVELRNRLSSALEQALPATILFDYSSSAALAEAILGVMMPPSPTSTPAVDTDDLLQDIAAMSDEEAERLLARELEALD